MPGSVASVWVRARKVRRRSWVRDRRRAGVGVGAFSAEEEGSVVMVWMEPKERYWELLGMGGGRRVRRSGGSDISLGRGFDGERGYEEEN